MAQQQFSKVVVIGAGPAGLLLALLLSQHNIPVEVLEASPGTDRRPRAAYYGQAALPDLERAGVLDEIRSLGFPPTKYTARKFGGDYPALGLLDTEILHDINGKDLRTACLPQKQLLDLLVKRLEPNPLVTLSWSHKVIEVGQDEGKAWVKVESLDGEKVVEADYIVGCDGAHSTVRKSLFGDDFPGKTWDVQLVSTDLYYDLEKFGFTHANFIEHPTNFFIAAKLNDENLWRVTYGEPGDLPREEAEDRLPSRLEELLPGHPKPDQYNLLGWAPHKIHQRCVLSMRVGRLMVASDAAHLCNPLGGLGVTGGIVDVGGLADCLVAIYKGQADESILDIWSDKRREKWHTITDAVTSENFTKTTCRNPPQEVRQIPWWTKSDEDRKKFLLQRFGLRYDFSQHFKNDAAPVSA